MMEPILNHEVFHFFKYSVFLNGGKVK